MHPPDLTLACLLKQHPQHSPSRKGSFPYLSSVRQCGPSGVVNILNDEISRLPHVVDLHRFVLITTWPLDYINYTILKEWGVDDHKLPPNETDHRSSPLTVGLVGK